MTEVGTVIDGKYEILKELGRGGMSIVYLAMDKHLNKQWAVKEIKKTLLHTCAQAVYIPGNQFHSVLPPFQVSSVGSVTKAPLSRKIKQLRSITTDGPDSKASVNARI